MSKAVRGNRSDKTDWKKKRRQEYLEMKKYRYYIFCEGQQTEPQYFTGLKRLIEDNPIYRDMVLIEIEPCGAETMRIIQRAEDYVKRNHIIKGQIWCVYDKDSFPAKDFNGVAERAAEYIRFLNEKFAELKIGKYQKNMKNIFDVLLEYGNPKLAVRYAKRILKDGSGKTPAETAPATKVHELVVELAKYLPEEINEGVINFVSLNIMS